MLLLLPKQYANTNNEYMFFKNYFIKTDRKKNRVFRDGIH
jgi:hypothetical protein